MLGRDVFIRTRISFPHELTRVVALEAKADVARQLSSVKTPEARQLFTYMAVTVDSKSMYASGFGRLGFACIIS